MTTSWLYLGSVLLVVVLVWIPLFLVRIHAHQANVDDYWYAYESRALNRADDQLVATLHTGQSAPLVLFLAIPGVATFGLYGAMAVELPILLALAVGAFVLSRQWLSPFGAAVTSFAVALNSAVLGYSVMLNFALAATAATLWCFASYMRSNRLRDWWWSIGFGLSFALLVLSRTIAPVYAIPMVVVFAVDLAVGARRNGQRPGWPAVGAVGTAIVVAGPWWLVSGRQALHYLTYAGYQTSSGYTTSGFILTPAAVYDRARYELFNLGWGEADLLCILVVLAVLLLVFVKRARQLPRLWQLAAWVVLSLLLLSSSSNYGTAFGLPLIAVTIVFCGAVLGNAIRFGRLVLPLVLLTLLVAGGASQFGDASSPWWHGPPYRSDVLAGGGSARTNVDQLTDQVAHALGPGLALVALNGPIAPVYGLMWYAPQHTVVDVNPTGSSITRQVTSILPTAHSLVTGATPTPYDTYIDQSAIEKAAIREGFRPTQVWNVSKGANVVVWHRGSAGLRTAAAAPTVWLTVPRNGAELSGTRDLVADARDVIEVSNVSFVVSGDSLPHPVELAAAPFLFGWLGILNVNTLSAGQYSIRAKAENLAGATSYSQPVTVAVVNHAG